MMLSSHNGPTYSGFDCWIAIGLSAILLLFVFATVALAQEHDMSKMPAMHMNTAAPSEDPAQEAKRLADKKESEFNHRFAGVFVIVAGIFILSESYLSKRWPLAHYAWPLCFLAVGLFLLVFSDTEIWPFGPQSLWYAVTHNREDLQHKVFSIILLAIGCVELQRARGRLQARWATWFFPAVGVAGAILLLFHVHGGDMQAPHAMETMEHIQKEHRWFAATGLGVALTNGLAGTPQKWQQLFKKAWPLLLILLGVLLTQYTE
jgi:putative copper resistance protein D